MASSTAFPSLSPSNPLRPLPAAYPLVPPRQFNAVVVSSRATSNPKSTLNSRFAISTVTTPAVSLRGSSICDFNAAVTNSNSNDSGTTAHTGTTLVKASAGYLSSSSCKSNIHLFVGEQRNGHSEDGRGHFDSVVGTTPSSPDCFSSSSNPPDMPQALALPPQLYPIEATGSRAAVVENYSSSHYEASRAICNDLSRSSSSLQTSTLVSASQCNVHHGSLPNMSAPCSSWSSPERLVPLPQMGTPPGISCYPPTPKTSASSQSTAPCTPLSTPYSNKSKSKTPQVSCCSNITKKLASLKYCSSTSSSNQSIYSFRSSLSLGRSSTGSTTAGSMSSSAFSHQVPPPSSLHAERAFTHARNTRTLKHSPSIPFPASTDNPRRSQYSRYPSKSSSAMGAGNMPNSATGSAISRRQFGSASVVCNTTSALSVVDGAGGSSKACGCPSSAADHVETMQTVLLNLYKEQIPPAFEEIRRRLEKHKPCEYLANNFVDVCRVDSEKRFVIEDRMGETLIYFQNPPKGFVDFIDPNSMVFPYSPDLIPLLFFHLVDRYRSDPKGEAYKGGRFLLAELLRSEGPCALRMLTQGELCHLLQKCLDMGVLSYENNSIRPAVACNALCKAYSARNCSALKPAVRAKRERDVQIIRQRLKRFLDANPLGLAMCRLPIMYKHEYDTPLNIEGLGYTKLADFLQRQASDICVIKPAARHRCLVLPKRDKHDLNETEGYDPAKDSGWYKLPNGEIRSQDSQMRLLIAALKSHRWSRLTSYSSWLLDSPWFLDLAQSCPAFEDVEFDKRYPRDVKLLELCRMVWGDSTTSFHPSTGKFYNSVSSLSIPVWQLCREPQVGGVDMLLLPFLDHPEIQPPHMFNSDTSSTSLTDTSDVILPPLDIPTLRRLTIGKIQAHAESRRQYCNPSRGSLSVNGAGNLNDTELVSPAIIPLEVACVPAESDGFSRFYASPLYGLKLSENGDFIGAELLETRGFTLEELWSECASSAGVVSAILCTGDSFMMGEEQPLTEGGKQNGNVQSAADVTLSTLSELIATDTIIRDSPRGLQQSAFNSSTPPIPQSIATHAPTENFDMYSINTSSTDPSNICHSSPTSEASAGPSPFYMCPPAQIESNFPILSTSPNPSLFAVTTTPSLLSTVVSTTYSHLGGLPSQTSNCDFSAEFDILTPTQSSSSISRTTTNVSPHISLAPLPPPAMHLEESEEVLEQCSDDKSPLSSALSTTLPTIHHTPHPTAATDITVPISSDKITDVTALSSLSDSAAAFLNAAFVKILNSVAAGAGGAIYENQDSCISAGFVSEKNASSAVTPPILSPEKRTVKRVGVSFLPLEKMYERPDSAKNIFGVDDIFESYLPAPPAELSENSVASECYSSFLSSPLSHDLSNPSNFWCKLLRDQPAAVQSGTIFGNYWKDKEMSAKNELQAVADILRQVIAAATEMLKAQQQQHRPCESIDSMLSADQRTVARFLSNCGVCGETTVAGDKANVGSGEVFAMTSFL